MRVWRIYDASLSPDQAVSGWGAFTYGGRWNSEGHYVVYTSEHLSLAAFEKLVHLDDEEALRIAYLKMAIDVPDKRIGTLPAEHLPRNWRSLVDNSQAQRIGDDWLRDPEAPLALKVPSVVIPEEYNVLINPKHKHWKELGFHDPSGFEYDPRLSEYL